MQRAKILVYIRFSKIKYSQSKDILKLLTTKSNIENLIKNYSNALIQVTKSVDKSIFKIKALK